MPNFYKIDKARRLVLSTGSGVIFLSDLQAHQLMLWKDPDFDPAILKGAEVGHPLTDESVSARPDWLRDAIVDKADARKLS